MVDRSSILMYKKARSARDVLSTGGRLAAVFVLSRVIVAADARDVPI